MAKVPNGVETYCRKLQWNE